MEHTSMPDFQLPLVGGGFIRKRDFTGKKPLALIFWPSTSLAEVVRVARAFAGRVAFAIVLEHADTADLGLPIALEAVGGRLHRAMNPKPDTIYVVDRDGWLVEEIPIDDVDMLENTLRAIVPEEKPNKLAKQMVIGASVAAASLVAIKILRGRRRSPIKGAVAGAIAGLAGSWAMTGFHELWFAVEKKLGRAGLQSEPATVKTAREAFHLVHRELPDDMKSVAGKGVHYAFGALSGAAYGAAAEKSKDLAPAKSLTRPRAKTKRSLAHGAAFGSILWATADETMVPALKLSGPPWQYSVATHVRGLLAHVVYGCVTENVRRLLRSSHGSR